MRPKTASYAIIAICTILTICSCKSIKTAKPDVTPVPDDGYARLSLYPYDLLPLYESTKVTYGLFESNLQDGRLLLWY